ncbi:hypothetical protein PSPO01_15670 [Paraphaeosphaeria sporulosa]
MPEQPPKKNGGEVHTFYSCCTNKESSSSETDNSNSAGKDDSSDGGFSTAKIWLEFSAEAEKQVAGHCSSESGMTAYPLPPGTSNSRQKLLGRDEADNRAVEKTRTQPEDTDETMLIYVMPVQDGVLAEAMPCEIQDFPCEIQLDVTRAILSALTLSMSSHGDLQAAK